MSAASDSFFTFEDVSVEVADPICTKHCKKMGEKSEKKIGSKEGEAV